MEPEEVERCKLALMGKSVAEITEFEGISIERLKELAIAEKEGRLVVLPEVAKALAVALMQVFAFEEAERALEGGQNNGR